ncbi:hypothetical protein Micbo1qcDRAFT_214375 [Microdochium bolleyi]|uniref:Velvet domain-containing protein n=1 Tax=Microdochium bolleyi TaxID=196109 RepID=A0A136IU20_9PEZI|nr:hypothetical protein Micbo1qcDRAFT_214375 [Microdochium bolleyi]
MLPTAMMPPPADPSRQAHGPIRQPESKDCESWPASDVAQMRASVEMVLVQPPEHCKVTTSTDKVRHYVDPPPVLRMQWKGPPEPCGHELQYLTSPRLFCNTYLEAYNEDPKHTDALGVQIVEERLFGELGHGVTPVTSLDNSINPWVAFPRIMIKERGMYRLRFVLFYTRHEDSTVHYVTEVTSNPFQVYDRRDQKCPAPAISSDLTKALHNAKIRMKLNTGRAVVARNKKRRTDGSEASDKTTSLPVSASDPAASILELAEPKFSMTEVLVIYACCHVGHESASTNDGTGQNHEQVPTDSVYDMLQRHYALLDILYDDVIHSHLGGFTGLGNDTDLVQVQGFFDPSYELVQSQDQFFTGMSYDTDLGHVQGLTDPTYDIVQSHDQVINGMSYETDQGQSQGLSSSKYDLLQNHEHVFATPSNHTDQSQSDLPADPTYDMPSSHSQDFTTLDSHAGQSSDAGWPVSLQPEPSNMELAALLSINDTTHASQPMSQSMITADTAPLPLCNSMHNYIASDNDSYALQATPVVSGGPGQDNSDIPRSRQTVTAAQLHDMSFTGAAFVPAQAYGLPSLAANHALPSTDLQEAATTSAGTTSTTPLVQETDALDLFVTSEIGLLHEPDLPPSHGCSLEYFPGGESQFPDASFFLSEDFDGALGALE